MPSSDWTYHRYVTTDTSSSSSTTSTVYGERMYREAVERMRERYVDPEWARQVVDPPEVNIVEEPMEFHVPPEFLRVRAVRVPVQEDRYYKGSHPFKLLAMKEKEISEDR